MSLPLRSATRTRSLSRLRVLAFAPVLALSLVACGSGDSGGSGSSGSGSSAGSDSSAGLDWYVDYAACMREQGINVPDPTADGQISTVPEIGTDAGQAADAACRDKLGPAPEMGGGGAGAGGGAGGEAADDANLDLAACLREQGYDVPDPVDGQPLELNAPASALEQCGLTVAGS